MLQHKCTISVAFASRRVGIYLITLCKEGQCDLFNKKLNGQYLDRMYRRYFSFRAKRELCEEERQSRQPDGVGSRMVSTEKR